MLLINGRGFEKCRRREECGSPLQMFLSPFLSFGVIIRMEGFASCLAGPAAPDWQSLCAWPRGALFLCCHHISCPGASVRTDPGQEL